MVRWRHRPADGLSPIIPKNGGNSGWRAAMRRELSEPKLLKYRVIILESIFREYLAAYNNAAYVISA
jgi:hypothetical protein